MSCPKAPSYSNSNSNSNSRVKMLAATSCALLLFLILVLVVAACTSTSQQLIDVSSWGGMGTKTTARHVIHASTSTSTSSIASPQKLLSIALKAALAIVHESHTFAKNCSKSSSSGQQGLHLLERQAIEDCIDMMEKASDQLNLAIANLSSITISSRSASNADALLNLNVWLSASLSFQATCSDGFQFVSYGKCERAMLKRQEQVAEVLANSLAIVKKLFRHGKSNKRERPHDGRRLLAAAEGTAHALNMHVNKLQNGFPQWLSIAERNLLIQAPAPAPLARDHVEAPAPMSAASTGVHPRVYADMVVAQDGSGDYLNISAALNSIPTVRSAGAQKPFVLYIKEGVYEEIVSVPKELANLTFVGDGIGNTVITGSNNVGSGLFNTFRTATVGISGERFMARDITFRNTAGAAGYQAVALRGYADYLVFYRCSFEGYQDTVYALSSRQFYRDCIIEGTVDFIFGNAIASFQSCRLRARRPLKGQQNTFTAQGRKIELDISGFSFQNCTLEPAPELVTSPFPVASYLGRPWKDFSRTVFLQCMMEELIHPAGWLPWNASNPFTDTVYYGEFQNRGAGSAIDKRVAWKGVHPLMNASDAALFTAESFIVGSAWIPVSQVAYTSGLLNFK